MTDPQPDALWKPVLESDQLPDGSAREVVVDGRLVALFRHGGSLYALEALCAHHGGPLAQGTVRDGCVTCPWHGWQYHLATGCQVTSGQPLIDRYEVREREGKIEVQVASR